VSLICWKLEYAFLIQSCVKVLKHFGMLKGVQQFRVILNIKWSHGSNIEIKVRALQKMLSANWESSQHAHICKNIYLYSWVSGLCPSFGSL
jgi:hypothetical protein